jgi:hypothetical protein
MGICIEYLSAVCEMSKQCLLIVMVAMYSQDEDHVGVLSLQVAYTATITVQQ